MTQDSALQELQLREPIFHRPKIASTRADFDRMMTPDFWEIGASGQRYDRDFVLRHLEAYPPVDADEAGWHCSDFACRLLGSNTFLLTYALDQAGRHTRRATIWQRTAEHWQVLYHQGTLVTAADAQLRA